MALRERATARPHCWPCTPLDGLSWECRLHWSLRPPAHDAPTLRPHDPGDEPARLPRRGNAQVGVSTRRAPEGIRTPNLLIRSQMLYPLSYGCRCSVVVRGGSGI